VVPYQCSLACELLAKNTGVSWAGINNKKTIIVADVHQFPGHIPCDSRSNSEIVVPLFDTEGNIWGVLDVDSCQFEAFSTIDKEWLEKITALLKPNPEELKWLFLAQSNL